MEGAIVSEQLLELLGGHQRLVFVAFGHFAIDPNQMVTPCNNAKYSKTVCTYERVRMCMRMCVCLCVFVFVFVRVCAQVIILVKVRPVWAMRLKH